MIGNLISLKSVIAKVMADNNIQEDTTRIADFKEWGAEAIERIGAFKEYEVKVAGKGGTDELLEVENYQATLPDDFHSPIQAAWNDTGIEDRFYSMRYATGSFDAVRGLTNAGEFEEEDMDHVDFNGDAVYYIKPGYMVTNFPTGYILLAYRAIPTDDDGYPTIPDNPGFVDAIYWYITMKHYYPMWVTGQVRDAVYYDAQQKWNFYAKQAYGNSMMPQGDDVTTIKNVWNKLVPDMTEEDTFFSTIGEREYIKNQTNYRYGTF